MTHNTKGENPLDVPNIEEETNAFPSNGYGLYINKRTLDHLHTLVVVWCGVWNLVHKCLKVDFDKQCTNHLMSGQMSMNLLES